MNQEIEKAVIEAKIKSYERTLVELKESQKYAFDSLRCGYLNMENAVINAIQELNQKKQEILK